MIEYAIFPQKIINITQRIKLSNYRVTNEFILSNDNTYVNHKRIVYGL